MSSSVNDCIAVAGATAVPRPRTETWNENVACWLHYLDAHTFSRRTEQFVFCDGAVDRAALSRPDILVPRRFAFEHPSKPIVLTSCCWIPLGYIDACASVEKSMISRLNTAFISHLPVESVALTLLWLVDKEKALNAEKAQRKH